MAVDTATDLRLAWRVETARSHETNAVAPLLDKLHTLGIDADTCALDKGYDNNPVYADCSDRGIIPVMPLRESASSAGSRTNGRSPPCVCAGSSACGCKPT